MLEIKEQNLETEYRKCIAEKNLEKLSGLMEKQLNFMKSEAVSEINTSNIVQSEIHPEYIECIPKNLFVDNGSIIYSVKESGITKRISLGVLLMRTIDALSELGKDIPELTRENLIKSLNAGGYKIDDKVIDEYNEIKNEFFEKRNNGSNYKTGNSINKENPVMSALDSVKHDLISKKRNLVQPNIIIERLISHTEEMQHRYDGNGNEDYFEKIRKLGPAHEDELSICKGLLEVMSHDPDWDSVSNFTMSLIQEIKLELNVGGINGDHVVKANPIQEYKKFNYGDEFKDYICPNPFVYTELTGSGNISVCCYLKFDLGNMLKEDVNKAWNSEAMQELRKSILDGSYSYCDKSKCAAMQEVKLPKSNNPTDYQLPYTLIKKDEIDNETILKCIETGQVDNLPAAEIISMEDDESCNLSCPSCRQSIIALNGQESNKKLELQTKLIDSLGSRLKELWLCGAGDPFAAKSYRDLLKNYDFQKYPDLQLRLDTNGILFNENTWNTTLKNVQDKIQLLAFSIDAATEETYEVVRRGGKFKTILKNLGFVDSLPQRRNGMGFIIRMIVQEKNFREMKNFVELGKSYNVDSVVFSVMQNWGTFTEQDYLTQAVHLEEHPEHKELLEILADDIFNDPVVNLGNLKELHYNLQKKISDKIITYENNSIEADERLTEARARVIAFYLPQFHPIPENDKWWGKGFTEWSNVGKAKPLYEGHYQPRVPTDLGYYDLRVSETREAQAELAKYYGIEAFCYWHYWFAGYRLLERPFDEVLKSGKPDFPFCIGWANQTWSGIWHGAPNKILIEQTYPGLEDYKKHFYSLLPAFRNKRYFRINDKPVFLIYSPTNLPNSKEFTSYWQELAKKEGLGEIHFIAHLSNEADENGCQHCADGASFATMNAPLLDVKSINNTPVPKVHHYEELLKYFKNYQLADKELPVIFPNWDNTPRSGANGVVLHGSTPELFKAMLEEAIQKVDNVYEGDEKIVFIKAWNEWAEGNHLEPDLKYGHKYLEVVKETLYKKPNENKKSQRPESNSSKIEPVEENVLSTPIPWSADYYTYRSYHNEQVLKNENVSRLLRSGIQIPDGFAVGLDERSIEYPWFFAFADRKAQKILDAGSALNHPEVINNEFWKNKELSIVTLAPESNHFDYDWIKYIYSDLRELPFEDSCFDEIISISTLEHLGMDNTLFKDTPEYKEDKPLDYLNAIGELRRVLKPTGRLLMTVPFGKHINYGTFQQFDKKLLDEGAKAFGATERLEYFYYYSKLGWKFANTYEQCFDAEYSAYGIASEWGSKETNVKPDSDGAAAARAIACCIWK